MESKKLNLHGASAAYLLSWFSMLLTFLFLMWELSQGVSISSAVMLFIISQPGIFWHLHYEAKELRNRLDKLEKEKV